MRTSWEQGELTSKRPYQTPELTKYGSIVNLTQNATRRGKTDNGTNKT